MGVPALASPPAVSAGGEGGPRVALFNTEWCVGPQINLGGSDYWRLALPASQLFQNGWDVKFARNLAETPSGRIAIQDPAGEWVHDRDVIVIQRWMGEKTAEKIERAKAAGQVIINEVDDNYWDFPDSHDAAKATDPLLNSEFNREHYRETVCASSLITVSTPHLAKALGDWGPPVQVVRNFIDCDFWPLQPPGDYVGWVGGLPWRGNDLEILRETVVPWLRSRKQFFYHGGDVSHLNPITSPRASRRLGYDRVSVRPLSTLFGYPKLWEPLRVCLIPIDDTEFGRAKSWVKGLEACARGVPFIHSSHAEYDLLGTGLCARTPEDWVTHLEALEDPDYYESLVLAGRKRAEELDIKQNWEDWAEVLRNAASCLSKN